MPGEAEGRACHLGGRQDSDAQSCSGTLRAPSEMQQGQQRRHGGNVFTRSVGIPLPTTRQCPKPVGEGPGRRWAVPPLLSASTEPPTPPVVSGCRGQLSRWVTATHSPAGP